MTMLNMCDCNSHSTLTVSQHSPMSRRHRGTFSQRLHVFDMNSLDPVNLRSEGSLEGAISTLECHLHLLDEETRESLIVDLLTVKNRFEFVVAGKSTTLGVIRNRTLTVVIRLATVISEGGALLIHDDVVLHFPTQLDDFVYSLHSKLLIRLSETIPRALGVLMEDARSSVQGSQRCLRVLHDMLSVGDDAVFASKSTSNSRKGPKNYRHGFDAKVFQDLGMSIPTSRKEARSQAKNLLHDQRSKLQVSHLDTDVSHLSLMLLLLGIFQAFTRRTISGHFQEILSCK